MKCIQKMIRYRLLFVVLFGLLVYVPTQGTECPSGTMDIYVNTTKILFSTPGFPANYPRPLSCKYLFTASEGHVINFRVLTFDLFASIFCYRDVFDIYDGYLKYSPVMQSWCGGKDAGVTVQTTTNFALVTLQTVTEGGDRQGYEFEVWSEEQHLPSMGKAQLTLTHHILMAVSAVVTLALIFFVVKIVLREMRGQRRPIHDEDDYKC